jgi:uncharacterized protein
MLKNTFCHLPGVGADEERELWSDGIHCWDDFLKAGPPCEKKRGDHVPGHQEKMLAQLQKSIEHLGNDDPAYFARQLKSFLYWRFFPDFRSTIAYLDIETTGLGTADAITTIAIYDGSKVFHYVQGDNLDDFKKDIRQYKLLVTYNGRAFDVPFIDRYLNVKLNQPNIDLMYILRNLGYTGGLKGCERKLGVCRGELSDLDGFDAILLWNEYKRHNNQRALETLLAYNVMDVLSLEILLVKAYNKNLDNTPFHLTHKLPHPARARNPFQADEDMIKRILRRRQGPPDSGRCLG